MSRTRGGGGAIGRGLVGTAGEGEDDSEVDSESDDSNGSSGDESGSSNGDGNESGGGEAGGADQNTGGLAPDEDEPVKQRGAVGRGEAALCAPLAAGALLEGQPKKATGEPGGAAMDTGGGDGLVDSDGGEDTRGATRQSLRRSGRVAPARAAALAAAEGSSGEGISSDDDDGDDDDDDEAASGSDEGGGEPSSDEDEEARPPKRARPRVAARAPAKATRTKAPPKAKKRGGQRRGAPPSDGDSSSESSGTEDGEDGLLARPGGPGAGGGGGGEGGFWAALEAMRSRLWGHQRGWRPGQEWGLAAVMGRRRALLVAPTGTGKSLCYQVFVFSSARWLHAHSALSIC